MQIDRREVFSHLFFPIKVLLPCHPLYLSSLTTTRGKEIKLCLCDAFELLYFYMSSGNKKHLDKHEVPNRMFKCEELLALYHLAINMNITLKKISRALVEVITIRFLLYLNTVLNFTGERFLVCEGPVSTPGKVPQGL